MKTILLSLFAVATGTAFGALPQLDPATGTISTADNSYTGRDFSVPAGFKLEILYQTTMEEGAWLPTVWDDKGRLLVASNSRELMFRLTLPKVGEPGELTVEPIGLPIGGAHGLVRAFDALYLNIDQGRTMANGLYRVIDSNRDDKYDKFEELRLLPGRGDHGLHNLKLGPDGRIYMTNGFAASATFESSVVPTALLGVDNLVRRPVTGADLAGPGQLGWIGRFGAEAKEINLVATGFRNAVGIAFNKDNELFAWDSDTEFDMGAPWYRPNYLSHVIGGTDAGWRADASKHPFYSFDYFGPVATTGAGSPVGMTAGTGLKFPARYQDAVFLTDWSFGMLDVVPLVPDGGSYKGEPEIFAQGRPFGLVEVTVNKADGSLIIITGGTGRSVIFRASYDGPESTTPTVPDAAFKAQRDLRHRLEAFHGRKDPAAVALAWEYLGDADRSIRYAARVAVEWQEPAAWRERALTTERDARKVIAAIASLARVSAKDELQRMNNEPAPDPALKPRLVAALDRIDWGRLSYQDKLDLLRAYELTFIRLGPPDAATAQRLAAKFDPLLPASNRELNWALAEMLVYLQAPSAPAKLMALLRGAPSAPYYPITKYVNPILKGPARMEGLSREALARQEDQIQYAMLLRTQTAGWTWPLHEEYLKWFAAAAAEFDGGNRFPVAMENIRADAFGALSPAEVETFKDILAVTPVYKSAPVPRGRGAPASAGPTAGRGPAAPRGQGTLIPLPPGP